MTLDQLIFSLHTLRSFLSEHLGPDEADAAMIPLDKAAGNAIKLAKKDPKLHKLMQAAQRRKEKVTVETSRTATKGTGTTGGYEPRTRDINLTKEGEKDPGVLGHESMHFLSQVQRDPFWHPLRLNEYLAEYAGTAGDPSQADPGYEYGKLSPELQEGLKREYAFILSRPRDYVRPPYHYGQMPSYSPMEEYMRFWFQPQPGR